MSTPISDDREIIAYIANYIGCNPVDLSVSTTIRYDLGLDGIEAEEFIQTFSDHYDIDMVGYNHDHYFAPEAGCLWSFVRLLRTSVHTAEQPGKSTVLTVGDLIMAAKTRGW